MIVGWRFRSPEEWGGRRQLNSFGSLRMTIINLQILLFWNLFMASVGGSHIEHVLRKGRNQ
jgi:hypothetical protein